MLGAIPPMAAPGKCWHRFTCGLADFDDAARAWGNTIRLNGSTASREADFGEALVAAGDGVVTADAKAAFDRALALDRNNVMARFYIGMAADQDGRRADAETIWRELLASAPPEAPWIEIVRHAMARTAPSGTAPAAVTGTPGPSAADMAAAAKLPPDQQNQMIVGMVSRLADRLKQDGSDTEGWVRLIRSYRALGQNDKAEAALADARRALANDFEQISGIDGRHRNGRGRCATSAGGNRARARRTSPRRRA